MKPLLAKDLPTFLERFGNFIDAEFRHVEVISPTTMNITLACQDSARGFDWITINLEFSGINDARLLDNSKLLHVDMADAASIITEDNNFAFGLGKYSTILSIKNSAFYIICENIKYKEGSF